MFIIHKITVEILKKNKVRTLSTILGVILASALLFSISMLASSYQAYQREEAIKISGNHHLQVLNVNEKDLNENKKVKKTIYEQIYDTFVIGDQKVYLTYINVPYQNIFALEEGFFPSKENEVLVASSFARAHHITLNETLYIENTSYKVVGLTTLKYPYKGKNAYEESFYVTKKNKVGKGSLYIYLKETKGAYETTMREIAEELSKQSEIGYNRPFAYKDVIPNEKILSLSMEKSNYGQGAIIFLMTLLSSTVIGILCTLIISASFAISVTERKKLLGTLSSIGASPYDLLKSVFYEALLIGLIAIPLGFLCSFLVISGTLFIIKQILEDALFTFSITCSPFFIFLPLLFSMIVLLLSAFFPAKRASESMPIEMIKMHADMKGKYKKRKSIMGYIFGIEGELAHQSHKRNKSKYHVTTISLSISILLFMLVNMISTFVLKQIEINTNEVYTSPYAYLSLPEQIEVNAFMQELEKEEDIKDIYEVKTTYFYVKNIDPIYYTETYKNKYVNTNYNKTLLSVTVLDNKHAKAYYQKIGLTEDRPILLNSIVDKENVIAIYKPSLTIQFCNYIENSVEKPIKNCYTHLENFYMTSIKPLATDTVSFEVIVSKDMYEKLQIGLESILDEKKERKFYIEMRNPTKADQQIKTLLDKYSALKIESTYQNERAEAAYVIRNIKAIRFGTYAFIAFITLIALTSIFNTIHTNMELRKREFMVLESMGQSDFSFYKMLSLESILIGIRSLIYGLTGSYLIYLVSDKIFSLNYGEAKPIQISFPFDAMFICIISIFVLIFIIVLYSTQRIKKQNIIEVIREENI